MRVVNFKPLGNNLTHFVHDGGLLLDCIYREISRANLLGNSSSFAFLHVRLPDLLGMGQITIRKPKASAFTLSSNLVFPVSTWPRIQQIGLRKSSLFLAAIASSMRFARRWLASAFLCATWRWVAVIPSESSLESSSESESESESSSELSDSSSDEDDSAAAAGFFALAATAGFAPFGAAAGFAGAEGLGAGAALAAGVGFAGKGLTVKPAQAIR